MRYAGSINGLRVWETALGYEVYSDDYASGGPMRSFRAYYEAIEFCNQYGRSSWT